ncbi:MAG: hypothetical protein FWE91_10635 [Defluviitaleaceae bacterium]|nr:hypothetical protein [Defluviitaleaceae bacterium]MCL2836361.1 hypothetical protein [Defluviitaleaceae bacterium]
MDINCVSDCAYQQEGKCALTELPAASRLSMGVYSGGCLYYIGKDKQNPPFSV